MFESVAWPRQVLKLLDAQSQLFHLLCLFAARGVARAHSASFQNCTPVLVVQQRVDVIHQRRVALKSASDRGQRRGNCTLACSIQALHDHISFFLGFRQVALVGSFGHAASQSKCKAHNDLADAAKRVSEETLQLQHSSLKQQPKIDHKSLG